MLRVIGDNKYMLPKTAEMKVDAVIYANRQILETIQKDLSLQQLQNAASLPQVISPIIGMPDIHQGFGLPIGGVMATDGLISAGAVGMDINCGVRLLTSELTFGEEKFSQKNLMSLIREIEKLIPTGLGSKHKIEVSLDLRKIVNQGIPYLVKKGYASEEDMKHTEENGQMDKADFEALSNLAKKRAAKQIGTLGSGNHFIDIFKIEEIFDKKIARAWGLFTNQICVMIHSGSRALGHQTCTEYSELFWQLKDKYKIDVPCKGLAALPVESVEGKKYFSAMAACVNFAFCNRQMMSYFIRQVFKKELGAELRLLYDVAHNIAKWEEHRSKWVLVHRKGATRALPANHPQNPKTYLDTGHPAIVPGSMGTPSYIMVGLVKSKESFYSINHGAGRIMSRSQAKRTIRKSEFEEKMKGIVHSKRLDSILDEAPQVYKNIDEVIGCLVKAGLTKKIAKLQPLVVISGV